MSILVIRKHQRFAVRQSACLEWAGCPPCTGLLVEVSLDGCRFSVTGTGELAIGQKVMLRIDSMTDRSAQIRWFDDKSIGLLFDQPLHNAEIGALLRDFRCETESQNLRPSQTGSSKAA